MKRLIVLSIATIAFFVIDSEAQIQNIDESAWMTVASEKAELTFYSDADRSIVEGFVDGAHEMRFLPAIGSDGKPVDFTMEFLMSFSTSSRVFML